MRFLIIFFLFPLLSVTQTDNSNWIAPIANIEFSESKIIYSYSLDDCCSFERLRPVYYNETILEMKGIMGIGCIDDYKDMLNQFHDYLDDWYIGRANNKDKFNYLKATSLLIIWNTQWMDLIPDNSLEILGYLQNDMSMEVANAAKLVLALYYDYNMK